MSALKVSMFQLMESSRIGLTKLSGKSAINGNKKSINTLILEAIDQYLELSLELQIPPPFLGPWKAFTIRMPDSKKRAILNVCGHLQIKNGLPISMSAALNSAIYLYLKKHSVKV
ncbi:hypothetical protein ZMTM_24510 [Methyloradius palustris]|uniref:Uncharacterized protein n=2 Tax=Methyloradius palustris TaxID=2778876 RepID=A0A8D5G1L4_9PROT|nr:hypothetical protein ZMTM_24510 [Methyloradius palustris]